MTTGKGRRWSIEEEKLVRDLYQKIGAAGLAEMLKVPVGRVRSKAHQMGVSKGHKKRLIRPAPIGGESKTDYLKRLIQANVDVNERGCWEWRAAKSNGYGYLGVDGKTHLTHRLSWQIYKGEIGPGLFVCHRCDNPSCCNPEHFFLGTTQENTEDSRLKGRRASGERGGQTLITDQEVEDMRKEYRGEIGQIAEFAKRYNVSRDQIRNIVRGKQRVVGIQEATWETGPATNPRDLSGQKFFRLTVIRPAGQLGRNAISLCRCECGTEKTVMNMNLLSGQTKSCGCLSRETRSRLNKISPPRLGTGKNKKPLTEEVDT